ncbi:hypothetical protein QBC40DRAFT_31800 [Triangularia verruculosa]|uniref:TeaA receptor TeaR n=1 Tax=Triangularia verruculosa TaxID=2587418 RepID=A0AAN6XR58_9PEZI|nr:hypothetical protein QBC40DRAFT_31800 [Triangularia verruculosa]
MAAVSQTTTAVSPSAGYETGYSWDLAVPEQTEHDFHDGKQLLHDENGYPSHRQPLASQNGNSTLHSTAAGLDSSSRKYGNGDVGADMKSFDPYDTQNPHKESKPRSIQDHASSLGSSEALDGEARGTGPEDSQRKGRRDGTPPIGQEDNSKWIHRDKLARIESEELQAAGIFLPRQRDRARSKSQNRTRRDQSQDKLNGSGRSIGGTDHVSRSRKNSGATTVEPKTPDLNSIPGWDLRRPEEIVEEGDGYWVSTGSGKGASKIPVAKVSPVPIPSEHLERDTLLARKRDGSPGEDSILYSRTRARSGSNATSIGKLTPSEGTSQSAGQPNKRADPSPKKPATTRKPKAANGAAGRPKTRGGPSKDSTSGGTRPSTRSAEREFSSSSKPMEGEPPWMISAYRPDPRLPPDQQLLPTVAKRLAQERMEREGKFGNVYDREFRPLTDEGFLKPPENSAAQEGDPKKEAQDEEQQGDWPLRPEVKSPTPGGRASSYSTMPKISDKPTMSPLPSPRTPGPQQQTHPQPTSTVKVPEPPEDPPQKKSGCGCCIVM